MEEAPVVCAAHADDDDQLGPTPDLIRDYLVLISGVSLILVPRHAACVVRQPPVSDQPVPGIATTTCETALASDRDQSVIERLCHSFATHRCLL